MKSNSMTLKQVVTALFVITCMAIVAPLDLRAASIWPPTTVPATVDGGPDDPVEIGVKFRSDSGGTISGIRFYKASANNGTHTARLWSASGTLLATASPAGETASGWQQANFTTPVTITANTVYVASYHTANGHYSFTQNYFSGTGRDAPPLHAPADGVSGANGVYTYGPPGSFPITGWLGSNYWVDVVFTASPTGDTVAPVVNTFTIPATSTSLNVAITALTATDNTAVTGYLVTETSTAPLASDSRWSATAPVSYTFSTQGSKTLYAWAKDAAGNVSTARSATVTVTIPVSTGSTLWPSTTVPATVDGGADDPVEIGVKFRSDSGGTISGIRFYKASANNGTHTARLWSASGTLLATAGSASETASGWQQADFPAPVTITANTVYVASYHTANGHYSFNQNYFSGTGRDAPPLHAPADGVSGANGVYTYGPPGSFPTTGWFGSNYWVDVVFTASSTGDTVAPVVNTFTIPATSSSLSVAITTLTATDNTAVTGYLVTETSTAPLASDSRWSATAPVSYTFTTQGSKTLYAWAKDAAGNVSTARSATVTVTISTGDTIAPVVNTFTIPTTSSTLNVPITALTATDNTAVTGYLVTETSTAPLASDSRWSATAPVSYTFTTQGSKTLYAWAKDAAGNVSTARSATVTVTIPVLTGSTLWPSTTVPATVDGGPDDPVEIGVKFRSDSGGTISGIRFYKAAANNGSHTVRLWSASGALLATAGSASETASGWQQADFPAPVTITANTVYVASYHTANGHYSFNQNYFSGTGRDAPPLHAPADGVSGVNGVFTYGPSGSFPSSGWFGTNYWVDVVFTASTTGDTVAPVVNTFTIPATSSSLSVAITALTATDNTAVTGYLVTETSTVPLASDSRWSTTPPTSYTVATPGSKTLYAWAKDVAGNISIAKSAPVTVITAKLPILIISSATNPFSNYYGEILQTEGLNAFDQNDIASVSAGVLAAYDLVILGEMTLTASQVTMLSTWVNGGGKLIAMRPDKKLAALLGLNDQSASLSNGYLLVDPAAAPGKGIFSQTMQYHGPADLYGLNGASSLATLYSSASSATSNPAVTLNTVGSNGGLAAAFTYDLARSVIYTRQGNPAWAGQERDGEPVLRSDDMFYGAATFDPQLDWIDLTKVTIPQADEQQRLLANLIIRMNMISQLVPRFWYLPRNLPAVVVMTGDDHGNGYGGTAARFTQYQNMSSPGCSVDNWDCIRGTSYLYTTNTITSSQATAFNNAGFEVALHVSTDCANWTPTSLANFYSSQLAGFSARFPSLPKPVTNRTHCIAWSDYTTQATVEKTNGITLDTTYYYWPPHWMASYPGFFTGSGMPMRFTDASGTIIDVYQATTQMTDESGQIYPFTVNALLDRAVGPEGYFGAFVVNAHTDFDTSSVSDSVIQSALQRGVPVISAKQLLAWLNGRNSSTFTSLAWNGTTLGFSVNAGTGATGLTAMAPVPEGKSVTSVTRNGSPVSFSMAVIKGVHYARFATTGGAYQVTYAADIIPPGVTSVTPARDSRDVNPSDKIIAIFSEPVDPATITGSSFVLRNSSSAIVPASVVYNTVTRTAILTPSASLANGAIYTVTISGAVKDLAGNSLGSATTWNFTTAAVSTGPWTIWPASAVPAVVDAGPDDPVELGVKFRSDRNGYITGLRFYKSAANTGIHTGNLWAADGTRIATATFSSESSTGWQQVNFQPPVAITANAIYTASYHTDSGHYSYNYGYFNGGGVDSPPLHALPDGASGGNGVFAYGSGSNFPNQSWNGTNYWVDVVFSDTSSPQAINGAVVDNASQSAAPVLAMITVQPSNQRIAVGTSQQFTAMATYSNGTTKDITKQVSWSSSAPEIATVGSSGLVTAHGAGMCNISATLDGITGSTSSQATDGVAHIVPAWKIENQSSMDRG
ncbi:DUF4082 domain-containing protein [Pelotalea chapellei]|uniref:DUF4082 domain-containing protein n=1 Tax=Pelotalea chapellei TaxID=44671 RepID=A0ABS5U5A5_9BACT|nr:DUF4082 domain-containing protein [Pelotalea chapellei]MBT1070851.1 DUF4082 domain-containing protein [Pelotalea chapellei]